MLISYLSFLPLFYALQHIADIIYTSLTKRQFNPWCYLNLIDFFIFTIFFTNIITTYVRNLNGTWLERTPYADKAEVYARNYHYWPVSEAGIWIFGIVSLWLRLFYLLRYNEYLGKFFVIVESIFPHIALFFVFFLIELTFFSILSVLCFRNLSSYNTFN